MRAEDFLGYWLGYTQRCVAYAFAEVLQACCIECGKDYIVTPAQWGVLSLLYENDELTTGLIGQRRGLDAPTVSGIVTRLEQNRLVIRQRDEHDRRIVIVRLTDEGREITSHLILSLEAFHATLVKGFTIDEQQDLLKKLQRMIKNVMYFENGINERFGLLEDYIDEQRL